MQPYPTSNTQLPESSRPPAPPSVRNAVTIMYAGAAASLIGIAIDLATIGSLKANLVKKHPNLTPTQIDNLNSVLHVTLFGFGQPYGPAIKLYGILIWLIGLAVVILLWQRTSSAYFKATGQLS